LAYGGGGDSGQTDSIEFTPNLNLDIGKTPVATPFGAGLPAGPRDSGSSATVEDLVDEVGWDLIEMVAGSGWENNEGGTGSVTFNIVRGLATVSHTNYYDDSDSRVVEKIALPAALAEMATDVLNRFPAAKGMRVSTTSWEDNTSIELEAEDTEMSEAALMPLAIALLEFAKNEYLSHDDFEDAVEAYDTLDVCLLEGDSISLEAAWTETREDDGSSGTFSMETLTAADEEED
jgi:hypothetical protein